MTLGVVLFHSGIQLSGYNECPIIARIDHIYVLICLTISLSLVWYTLCLVGHTIVSLGEGNESV